MKKLLLFLLTMFSFLLLTSCNEKIADNKDNQARKIPMKDFFKNPSKTAFQLSPNGESFSFIAPYEKRMNIFIKDVKSGKELRLTSETDRSISGFFWANNNQICYLKDTGGDENFQLYIVDIDGENNKCLTPFKDVKIRIVDTLESIEDEVLISMNKRNPQIFDAYRLHLKSGKLDLIAENPGNIMGWGTDHNGKLRIATALIDGVNSRLLYRKSEKDPFTEVVTTNYKETLNPLFFTFDNKYLYASSNIGRDKSAIVKYDPETKKELEVIFEHPQVDVDNLAYSKKRKTITHAIFTTDKRNRHFFDQETKNLFEKFSKKLKGYEISWSTNKDETKYLIRTYSDRSIGKYYLYNKTTDKFTELAEVSPWINEDEMAIQKPISYQSRDGLTIHGYLTLPKGKNKNLPVIINPHGGPSARDHWGYNPEVQFLANRGYAVLQMNFRGSTGYGRKFWTAGFKKWGQEMQNDITDGVNWLIKEKIADPKRVAIYGASYGGYATLAGLTLTPDIYACGIDYVGVSNLFTLLKSLPEYWKPMREIMYEQIGHPQKDSLMFKKISPVFHADKIKVPLFIAQGARDPRVNKAESDQMVQALKKRGITVQYMVKENEGHGFHNEENRFDFYNAMEKFLGKHL